MESAEVAITVGGPYSPGFGKCGIHHTGPWRTRLAFSKTPRTLPSEG